MDVLCGGHGYSSTVGGAEKLSFAPFGLPMKKMVNCCGLGARGRQEIEDPAAGGDDLGALRATQKMVRRFWTTFERLTMVPLAKTLPLSDCSATPEMAKRRQLRGHLALGRRRRGPGPWPGCPWR